MGSDLNNSSYKFIRLFSKLKLSGLNLYMIQGIFTKKKYFDKIKEFAFLSKINLKILSFKRY